MEQEKEFEKEIIEAIEKSSTIYLDKDEYGNYYYEVYADYRDEIDYSTANEILKSKSPIDTFFEKLVEWYRDTEFYYQDEIEKSIRNTLEENTATYPDGLPYEQSEFLINWVVENIYYKYPENHYLKQEFCTNIMIDTGDGNYDYTLNAHYPCYCGGEKGEAMDNKASLVWLAKQQGYTKGQLRKALDDGDMANPKGFLESCRVEAANMSSHMQTLVFLVKMNLKTLMKINHLIQIREKGGHKYDATEYPNCGYITLSKDTMCGLFDPWNGGGSVLEINLEKDVKIPIKFIRSCLPDGGDGYGIDDVYGLCGSCWKDTLKEIYIPKIRLKRFRELGYYVCGNMLFLRKEIMEE